MQSLQLEISGLKTNPNPLTTKAGALSIADNINIDSPNTASSRRGFKKYASHGALTGGITWIGEYQNKLLAYHGSTISHDTATAWTAYNGTFTVPNTNVGFRSVEAEGSLYFGTTAGIYKIDGVGNDPYEAGVPKGITFEATLGVTAGAAITAGSQVVYRCVWGYKDSLGRIILGSPSERLEVVNTSTIPINVTLKVYIPSLITVDYFIQVYRTSNTGSTSITANDEMGLVYEINPNATDISNKYITIIDIADDATIGATIYTAVSQEGILNQNDMPPLALDMCSYKNFTFYANCKQKHRMFLTLTKVGVANGLNVGDVVYINGTAYTGVASAPTYTSGQFKVYTSGTVSQNIANTAKDLIKAINLRPVPTTSITPIYAYYASGYNDFPGQIIIERRDLTDVHFYAYIVPATTSTNSGAGFNPMLPVGSSTNVASINEDKPNRIYISKQYQPDAVPPLNYIDIGTENSAILRIVPLRSTIFVLKDNGEVWKLSGYDFNSFSAEVFDNTTELFSPKSAVVSNNQLFCFTTQGIAAISEGGIEVKSWDIEDKVIQYVSPSLFPTIKQTMFGVTYETGRKYMVFDGITQGFVYNAVTNSWTRYPLNAIYGYVNSTDDKMYLANTDGYIYQERKNYTDYDYCDDERDVTIFSSSGYNVVLVSATGIVVGETLRQGDVYGKIDAINGNTLTLDVSITWTASTIPNAVVDTPIECSLQWLPIFTDNAGIVKRFRELTIFFRDMNKDFDISFSNNFSNSVETITVNGATVNSAYGDGAYGDGAYGEAVDFGATQVRSYFPQSMQRALWSIMTFATSTSYTKFTMNGISIMFETASSRFNKDV